MAAIEVSGTAIVKKDALKRARRGMPWIGREDLVSYEGDGGPFADVTDETGLSVAMGLYDPDGQHAIRLIATAKTRDPLLLLRTRIERADARRRADLLGADAYRLCHGEADGVPGLFVDRFGAGLFVCTDSPRMEALLEHLLPALVDVSGAASIAVRPRGAPPRLVLGTERLVRFHHGRLLLTADLLGGADVAAATGDLENQRALRRWAKGRVLDVFAGLGGYGLQLCDAGAKEAVFLDADEEALSRIADDGERNGLGGKVLVWKADPAKRLRELEDGDERFDMVILHPPVAHEPAGRSEEASKAAFELARGALRLLDEGGLLVASSPSTALDDRGFAEAVAEAAGRARKRLQVIARFTQGPDHPLLLGEPEPPASFRLVARVSATG